MATQQEIIDAHIKFDSHAEAARHLGMADSTYKDNIKKLYRDLMQNSRRPGIESEIDQEKGAGWIQCQGPKIPDIEDLLKESGLDPACWIVTRIRTKNYQGFHKAFEEKTLKADGGHFKITGADIVNMTSVRFDIERVVTNAVQIANKTLASRTKPLPRPPKIKRAKVAEHQMAVLGLWDAHIGSLCWEGETDQNNDSPMALQRVKDAFDDMVREIGRYSISKIIFPFGNDFMHMDNPRGETTSGNVIVDFDTRYGKVLGYCHEAVFHMVDRCREICDDIDVVLVGGNHDRTTSLHIAHCIDQRYRNDDAITVDLSEHARKYVRWNDVLLMFTHGDRFREKEAYRYMTEEAREHISTVKCRECHFGDKHHRQEIDSGVVGSYGKVTLRRHPSIAPRDEWTFRGGFDAIRAAEVHRYGPDRWLSAHAAYARI